MKVKVEMIFEVMVEVMVRVRVRAGPIAEFRRHPLWRATGCSHARGIGIMTL